MTKNWKLLDQLPVTFWNLQVNPVEVISATLQYVEEEW